MRLIVGRGPFEWTILHVAHTGVRKVALLLAWYAMSLHLTVSWRKRSGPAWRKAPSDRPVRPPGAPSRTRQKGGALRSLEGGLRCLYQEHH